MLVVMEKVQINLKTPIKTYNEITFKQVFLQDKSLYIYVDNCLDLYSGDTISLRRSIPLEDGGFNYINYNARVKLVDYSEKYIVIDAPEEEYHYVDFIESKIFDENVGFIVNFIKPYNVFFQDAYLIGNDNTISLYDKNGDLINGDFSYFIFDDWNYESATSGTFLTNYHDEVSCNTCEDIGTRIYKYSYLPNAINQRKLLVYGLYWSMIDDVSYATFKYNPFFYTANTEDNRVICYFWCDIFYDYLKNNLEDCSEITRDQVSDIKILKVTNSWDIGFNLFSDINDDNLGVEDSFNSSVLDSIEESLVPDVIDMEKLKYVPIIKQTNELATGITLNFHFRKRKKNDDASSDKIYYDNWMIDTDEGADTWWNGYDYGSTTFNPNNFETFVKTRGETSDLLGYLNFTNDDVYYRKKKVSKSFVRLSFYNSKDIIEQKLLFYSTVFLDGGILYGKYLKQLLDIKDGKINVSDLNDNVNVVLCESGSNRVDSQIVITNEYDKTKSSEGFNIYLFAEDQLLLENKEKTIYMKVEFNHAGNGKTIPMIMWPKDREEYTSLTIDNFIDSLYIPVQIGYINGRYVYYIPNAINENGNINLILFEPKLEIENGED